MSTMKDLIPPETIQKECHDVIQHWTVTGLRYFDMYRLISNRFAPLGLGPSGRQKVCGAVGLRCQCITSALTTGLAARTRKGTHTHTSQAVELYMSTVFSVFLSTRVFITGMGIGVRRCI